MKSGHYIIIGILAWVTLTFSKSLWVYQIHGQLIAAGTIGLSSIIWLTKKENREILRTTLSSKKTSEIIGDKLLKTIQIGSIAIFLFIIIAFETFKIFVQQSEGYDFIRTEVLKNKEVNDQIGPVEHIGIGNKLSAGLLFKNSEKRLKTRLIVFGATGQIDIDVQATKTDDWKIDELRINNR
jgi:hypothetical protein